MPFSPTAGLVAVLSLLVAPSGDGRGSVTDGAVSDPEVSSVVSLVEGADGCDEGLPTGEDISPVTAASLVGAARVAPFCSAEGALHEISTPRSPTVSISDAVLIKRCPSDPV
jgi:hypothetical protein